MSPRRMLFLLALLLALSLSHAQTPAAAIDKSFQKFWNAGTPAQAERSIDDVVKSGVTFEDAYKRLKAGRVYTTQPTGIVKQSHKLKDGTEYYYSLNVPANYDPAKRYQVRFQLHGGVGGRENNQPRGSGESPLQSDIEQIYVVPYAWNDAPWWSDAQVRNLAAITDAIKRAYNVDENRVVVAGVSDGGTGAFFISMRDTTPYASFLPLNGFIMVLANGEIDDGRNFPNNLRNKPMFAVNGGKDPLYPLSQVEPFVKYLMSWVKIEYHPQPDAGHNTAWWPNLTGVFEDFVAAHPRDPHPDKLIWETDGVDHNRAHWLVIDELGPQERDAKPLPDLNAYAPSFKLFSRPKPAGRVEVSREGNTVQATTRGVNAFTLLLSPDDFDFAQPVKVVANGRTVFEGRVERDLKTLMKWAARDNDRTMLYAAELKIKLNR